LHLVNLKNATGEIGLRAGNSDRYFGVINIGDSANFLKSAEAAGLGFTFDEDALQGSLFGSVNRHHSPINVLLGAKKFVEGWSSWRVSSMGLLNVGKSEGSEIIQMFGRGVRLKGYNFSLKRSTALAGIAHPDNLPALETLNIFSINGNYLAKFKEYLEREGIATDFEEIAVPVAYQHYDSDGKKFAPAHTLYTIRPDADFDFTKVSLLLKVENGDVLRKIRPEFDLRPQLQTMTSAGNSAGVVSRNPTSQTIGAAARQLLDWDAIAVEIADWRLGKGYTNLTVSPTILRSIIEGECYALRADERLLNPKTFGGIARLQEVVIRILKAYIDNFYRYHKQAAEAPHLAYRLLDEQDSNLRLNELPDGSRGYLVKVPGNSHDPAIAALKRLASLGSDLYKKDIAALHNLNIHFDRHLYLPLLSAYGFSGTPPEPHTNQLSFIESITPVGLNQSETRFVLRLREYLTSTGKERLVGHHIYLLRNLSRGKGVGFFEAGNFYPDFILWVIDDKSQKIVFIDPKGLLMLSPNDFTHPKIKFAATIKGVERELNKKSKMNIQLESFIISETPFKDVKRTFAGGKHSLDDFTDHHVLFFDATLHFMDTLFDKI